MKAVIKLSIVLLLVSVLQAQTAAPKKKVSKPVNADVQALKDAVAAQQEQIKALSQQLQQTNQQLQQTSQQFQQAQQAAADASSKAAAAQAQASQQQQTVGELKGDVADLKTNFTNTALTVQETQKTIDSTLQNPLSIHYKGISFTTSAFVAAEFVRRSRELGADLTTPFNSLTMPGASQSNLSEFFGSARQSRPTLFVEGRLKNVELSSYISGDFLSAGVTSTATQTNSYTLRLRQAWGQAKFDNGWKFLGGQMWSLVTEGKAGIAPSDDLGKVNDARPSTIDPGYNVGFTFARQYGIRLTKDFGDKLSVAVAMENAQGTLTTHGNAANFLLGEAGASNSYNATSNYTANPAPDIIAKVAFDPGFGHYEVFGLVDRFTDRVFPCGEVASSSTVCNGVTGASVAGAYNASKEGGGFGANARWTFAHKHVVFGLHGFGGSGVGRYGASQLSDLSIHADGTIHLIKGLQGLTSLEWHGKKLDLYAYTGAEYAARTYDFDRLGNKGAGQYVGYGSPYFSNAGCSTELLPTGNGGFTPTALAYPTCTADTRAVIEGTAGFWYSFYNGPKGRFRFGTQYSYVTRQTWSGAASATAPGVLSPEGLDGMVFTSFRYYLP
ncbi:MAG: hypothetical protein ABR861_03990 [Terriglobales bacterium]|jgi:hypothetical protein